VFNAGSFIGVPFALGEARAASGVETPPSFDFGLFEAYARDERRVGD